MMINYQGEDYTETEFYGREILEAIQLTNKFPTPKKVLIEILEEMIHEQFDLIDKEEVKEETAKNFADIIKAKFTLASAKENYLQFNEFLENF